MNKIIFLCLILIVLLIFIKKRGKEYFLNKDFKIVMFLTEGLNKEAENCIQTLKNLNLDKQLIVTALDDNAYNYISNLGVKTLKKNTNLKKEADFGTKDFYEIMYNKLEIIKKSLINYQQIVIYSDSDIVFLKDISKDIQQFKKSDYDMMIQDDSRNFNKSSNLCAGFMIFKPNNKCIKCLESAIKIMKDNWDTHDKLAVGGGADQRAINLAIKQTNIKVGILDLKEYPNGSRYFNNITSIYKSFKPKIVHNNFIIGTKNKIERFKKHNLWFINLNKIETFTDNINITPKLYGTQYGGFYLPTTLTKDFFNTKNIIYYGVGVGEDMSFDLIIGKKLNANIILIDPTPRAKEHYKKIKKLIKSDIYTYTKQEGGGDKNYESIIRNNKIKLLQLKYEESGVGVINSTQKFYMNKNSNHISGSFDSDMNFVNKNNYINVHIKTIDSIMKKYNHKRIDILKLDIEGLEISVLNYILDKNILPKIICVDFDSVREGKHKKEFDLLKKRLKSKNYYLYHNDNLDITFIRN